jgi:hypothetical protein
VTATGASTGESYSSFSFFMPPSPDQSTFCKISLQSNMATAGMEGKARQAMISLLTRRRPNHERVDKEHPVHRRREVNLLWKGSRGKDRR